MLATLGVVGGTAGCVGGVGDTPSPTDRPPSTDAQTRSPTQSTTETQSPTETDSPTETNSPTETPTPRFSVERAEFVARETEYTRNAGVVTVVENEATTVLTDWELRAAFRDEADAVVGTATTRLAWLPAGDQWRSHVDHLGTEKRATGVDVSITEVTATTARNPDLNSVEGVGKVDSELRPPQEFTGPTVVGELANERSSELDYLQVTVLFGDGDAWRGSGIDNITDLPADSRWKYCVEYLPAQIEDASEISEYRVLVST